MPSHYQPSSCTKQSEVAGSRKAIDPAIPCEDDGTKNNNNEKELGMIPMHQTLVMPLQNGTQK